MGRIRRSKFGRGFNNGGPPPLMVGAFQTKLGLQRRGPRIFGASMTLNMFLREPLGIEVGRWISFMLKFRTTYRWATGSSKFMRLCRWGWIERPAVVPRRA